MKIKKIKSKEVREEAIRLAKKYHPHMPFNDIKNLDLSDYFYWEDSPQGYDFWLHLYEGLTKNTKDLELPEQDKKPFPLGGKSFAPTDGDYLFPHEDSTKPHQVNHQGIKELFDAISASPDHDPMRPDYYGGADNPYECRKVIAAWDLGFNLANVLKYVCRAGKKDPEKAIEDLQKAINYLKFEIEEL